MAIEYIKKATKTSATGEDDTRRIVNDMLQKIEAEGDDAAAAFARELDGWEGPIVVTEEDIAKADSMVSDKLKSDIQFSHERVHKFAVAQRASMQEFETELSDGLFAGQRLIPVNTAGCYVPGGRYAHIASAIMSVTTAKVAGVDNVIACSPPGKDRGIHPAIIYTARLVYSPVTKPTYWWGRVIVLLPKPNAFCLGAWVLIFSLARPRF